MKINLVQSYLFFFHKLRKALPFALDKPIDRLIFQPGAIVLHRAVGKNAYPISSNQSELSEGLEHFVVMVWFDEGKMGGLIQ